MAQHKELREEPCFALFINLLPGAASASFASCPRKRDSTRAGREKQVFHKSTAANFHSALSRLINDVVVTSDQRSFLLLARAEPYGEFNCRLYGPF
jgi:hypothetical protein